MVWKYAGRYVLPFSPSSMKMSIRWNTALTDTISSVNTRSLSKEYPQFTVNYSALLKGAGLQFATDRVLRDLGQEVLVPMWQDVATERISDTEVAISTTDKTFYKEGLQVMLWASDTEWQIVDVEQVNPSYIKFGVNSTDWKCVVPIEEGFIASSPTTSTDRNRNTKLNYVVTIKRLDGPLSSIGGGVIPGVYVNTFETLQTDFGSVIHSPNDSFLLIDKYVGANIKYRNDAIDSSNSMIYLGGDVTNRALHIFRRNLPNDELEMFMDVGGVRKQIRSNVTFASLFPIGITKSVHASLDITNPLGLPRLYIDGVEFTDFYILINDSISSFSAVDFSYRGGATFSNGSTAYDYYWSTDSNFSSPSSIAQYAQAPNALVNNRPFYTGRELFTQVAPDVVPYSVKSFKGNGVDSYIDKSNIGASSDVFSTSFIIKHEQMTTDGFIAVVQGADTDEAYYLVGMQTNNKLIVYSYNTIFQKAFETTNAFIVGEVYEILVKLDLAFGGFKVYVNDVLQTIAETFDGLPSVANPTSLVLTLGSFNQGVRNFYKGQIAELYWGSNPLIVDRSTMLQYATGEEHFTQVAPDALPSEWFGGAIQGTVEEGWEGGAVQGIVEVSPPIPAPLGPYPEDPKLTEVPIQSSKGNNYSLHINTVKSVGGVIKVNSTRSVPTVTTTHSWDNQSRAEYLDMLDFAAQCRGRKNAFDAASFKSDIIPLNEGTISDGYLDVLDPGLQSLNLVGTRFTVIRGRSWDSSEVYEVLSLENVTGGVRLVLDKAIIATIFTTDTVSNVRQSRLNSDVLEINIDSFNRSSASISVRDINEGG